jgi:hypothetical protein
MCWGVRYHRLYTRRLSNMIISTFPPLKKKNENEDVKLWQMMKDKKSLMGTPFIGSTGRDEHPRSSPVLGSILWLGPMVFEIESNRTD